MRGEQSDGAGGSEALRNLVSPATIVRSIWLDEENAHDQIGAKLRSGQITEREAANLTKFADDGYLVIASGVSGDDAADFDANVVRLWREKPTKIAYAYDSPPRRLGRANEREHRRPRYRIHDMHSAFETARRFDLDHTLLRYASLILDQPAVSTQSLYFEFGSQQALHRDSIVVPTPIFGELLAAWIALQDIDPASGPLEYVPGSHKLPKPRKSFVVHDSTLRNHPARSITLDEGGRNEVWTTRQLIDREKVRGFANPLDGELEYVRG